MHIVILDAHTANPGDLSWQPFEALGSCAVYPRTPLDSTIERCQGAAAVITNKAVLNRHILGSLPELRYIGVLATGYNVVDVAAAREKQGALTGSLQALSRAHGLDGVEEARRSSTFERVRLRLN